MMISSITSRSFRILCIALLMAGLLQTVTSKVGKKYSKTTARVCSERLNGPGGVAEFCQTKKWHDRCWAELDAVCSYRTDQERLEACCQLSVVKPECMKMCSFEPDFDFICNANCWSDYKRLIACAANGKDNTKCCKKTKKLSKKENSHCLQMCAGKAPDLASATEDISSMLKWQPCFQAHRVFMRCHQESYSSDDNWDADQKWKEEKVNPKMQKLAESFGKCEEKKKNQMKAEKKERKKETEEKKRKKKKEEERKEKEEKPRGSSQGKQERLEECCKSQKVQSGCMDLCSFEPRINLPCKSECFNDLKKVTYCAANGQDNTACCKQHEVFKNPKNSRCLQFCRGETPPLSDIFKSLLTLLAFQPCTQGMQWMLQCHKQEYPEKDEWKKRSNWRKESVPLNMKNTMESYGKCK